MNLEIGFGSSVKESKLLFTPYVLYQG